jgi:FAD-dependent oxidoreductase domain-containing protein 1
MQRLVDIAIIGGGVIGSSIAYHLMKSDVTLNVVVFEADPTYRTASSALSASSIRQQFSTPLNIAMSHNGMRFLSTANNAPEDEGEPHVGLIQRGYLYLASAGGRQRVSSFA